MIAPRKYVHSLLILSELILIACALIMIIKYDGAEWDRKIWIGSKLLTLKEMMKDNNNKMYPILEINNDGTKIVYNQSYESLLKHSGKECEENYKSCGILDTLGNKMCVPNEEPCPINDIVIGSASELKLYSDKGYKTGFLENMTEDQILFYTNETVQNQIVVKLNITNETLRYIHEGNLIFDNDTYDDYVAMYSGGGDGYSGSDWGGGWDSGGGDWGGGGIDSGGGGFRRLEDEEEEDSIYGSPSITKYIRERFNDEINIDKTFRNISDNLFAGNYLGFHDYSNYEKFSKLDLYDIYFTPFPNLTASVFSYFLIVGFIGLIIFSVTRFCHKDKPNEGFDPCAVLTGKLLIIIPYLIFYIGYFIYIVYEYCHIHKDIKQFELTEIKADPFLEDLLKEINGRHMNEELMLILIILFSSSMAIFLLAWVLSQIFTKRYLDLLNKTTNNTNEPREMLLK